MFFWYWAQITNKESALAEMRRAVAPGPIPAEVAYRFDLGKLSDQDAQTFARIFQTACPEAFRDPRGAGKYWGKVLGPETLAKMQDSLKELQSAKKARQAFWDHEAQMMEPWKHRDPAKYAAWEAGRRAEGF